MIRQHIGDCRQVLRTMPDESVHCVVTSPPYFGLRDYGIASQIGLEATPDAYVAEMVAVFREVKRVLRTDGVCFLNLGDSYCSNEMQMAQYELRNDLSLKEIQDVALAMFGVWITGDESSRKRVVPEVLFESVQNQEIFTQSALASRRVEEKLSEAPSSGNSENIQAEQADQDRRDSSVGRQMRLLWGDDPAISDLGPHQRGWCGPSEEDGAVNHSDLSASASRGISETQISRPVFQLQLRDRIMGLLSARKFTKSEVPTSIRTCFKAAPGLKPKDLVGIPWRVAFALQADGWYLRQDIIWAKKNCMPESVTDRCTKAHEYLFLLSKTPKYYYDAVSISEESKDPEDDARRMRQSWEKKEKHRETSISSFYSQSDEPRVPSGKRNKRSVWEVATQPFSEAHFATFPPALIEPCILAGCPKDGTVLDPFAGAGTTGLVADRLQRNAILIELNPTYAGMSARRITDDGPLFAKVVMADDDAGAEKVGNGPAAPAAEDFDPTADFVGSLLEAYGEIRERMAAGGPGWTPKEPSND